MAMDMFQQLMQFTGLMPMPTAGDPDDIDAEVDAEVVVLKKFLVVGLQQPRMREEMYVRLIAFSRAVECGT